MLSTRQGALALALLCAIAATGVLIFALGRYRHSVGSVTRQATVLVATGLIQKGQSGTTIAEERLYRPMPVLDNQVPPGALTDASALRGKFAAADILPGQKLTDASFASGSAIITRLAPSQRAISLNLDQAHGLGGVLAPGDHVDVYGGYTVQGSPVMSLLVPDAVVLKTPAGTGNDQGAGNGGTVVLQVSVAQAPELAYTSDNAKLWLMLRPAGATAPIQTLTTADSILFGVHPNLKAAAIAGVAGLSTPTGGQP